jgi:hypothetical protein
MFFLGLERCASFQSKSRATYRAAKKINIHQWLMQVQQIMAASSNTSVPSLTAQWKFFVQRTI